VKAAGVYCYPECLKTSSSILPSTSIQFQRASTINYVDEAENKDSMEDQAVVRLDVVCIQLGNLVGDGSWQDTRDVGDK
jgi:hypothetical protein